MIPPAAIPAYRYKVINLARAAERREIMTAQIENLGIADKADFFPAVDGATLRGDADVTKRVKRSRYVSRGSLSHGEVGCMESHRGAWRDFLGDASLDYCVILEDDAVLSPEMDAVIVSLLSGAFGAAADFVRLQVTQFVETRCVALGDLGAGRRLTLDYGPKPGGGAFGVGLTNTTGVLRGWLGGTVGYVVSRAGAERLLAFTENFARPADTQLTRFWEYGLPPLVVYPAVVEATDAIPSEAALRWSYAAPPFAWWDPRYQLSRVVRAYSRRLDVWRYRRFVSRLQERHGAPDHTHPPTFRYDERGLARSIPRD